MFWLRHSSPARRNFDQVVFPPCWEGVVCPALLYAGRHERRWLSRAWHIDNVRALIVAVGNNVNARPSRHGLASDSYRPTNRSASFDRRRFLEAQRNQIIRSRSTRSESRDVDGEGKHDRLYYVLYRERREKAKHKQKKHALDPSRDVMRDTYKEQGGKPAICMERDATAGSFKRPRWRYRPAAVYEAVRRRSNRSSNACNSFSSRANFDRSWIDAIEARKTHRAAADDPFLDTETIEPVSALQNGRHPRRVRAFPASRYIVDGRFIGPETAPTRI